MLCQYYYYYYLFLCTNCNLCTTIIIIVEGKKNSYVCVDVDVDECSVQKKT